MKKYLIEAWALGMFMISAATFAALIWLPALPVREALGDQFTRRLVMGLAMGTTAALLIYSRWGKISGAHMNPAVTLAFWSINKISSRDAVFYILAQFFGGCLALLVYKFLFFEILSDPAVNYVQTLPGIYGIWGAFFVEMAISFALFLTVLYSSNYETTAPYTGFFAAALVMLYITFEEPISGMSMNPARTFASAVAAGNFAFLWLYFTAPVLGMVGAARVWKIWICRKPEFKCSLNG